MSPGFMSGIVGKGGRTGRMAILVSFDPLQTLGHMLIV